MCRDFVYCVACQSPVLRTYKITGLAQNYFAISGLWSIYCRARGKFSVISQRG